jgi:hypothetical protein
LAPAYHAAQGVFTGRLHAADPEEVVQKGLEDLARHLGSRFDYFEAIVFARGE